MKKLYNFLLPKYTRLPLLLVVLFNCFVFWFVPFIQEWVGVTRYDLTDWPFVIDSVLPFIPAFMLVYVLSYVQWVGSYIYHSRESRALCYRMTTSDLIAKAIVLLFFLFLPTGDSVGGLQPEVVGNGPFEWLSNLIFSADKPISLFPSIHCLESWMCFRTATMMAKPNRWYCTAQFVFTLLVFASVVLVKQHFFIDIIGGVVVAEIGLFIYKKWDKTHIFEKVKFFSAR